MVFSLNKKLILTALSLVPLVYLNPVYSWLVIDDFDTGVVGNPIDLDGDAAGGTVYSLDKSYSGKQSAKLNIIGGQEGFGMWGGRWNLPRILTEGDEIWVRVRTFFPEDFDFTTNFSLKFLRLHVGDSTGGHIGYTDIYINNNRTYKYQNELYPTARLITSLSGIKTYKVGEIITGQTSGASTSILAIKPDGSLVYDSSVSFLRYETVVGAISGATETITKLANNSVNDFGGYVSKNEWETIYYHIKYSSKFGNALVEFFKETGGQIINGKRVGGSPTLLFSEKTDLTLNSPTDIVDAFLLFTYWNGSAPKTQHMYVDDLYISNEMPPELIRPNPPRITNVK